MNAQEKTIHQSTSTKRLTNTWLVFLMVVLGLATLVTAVLVAWPMVAYIAARLFG